MLVEWQDGKGIMSVFYDKGIRKQKYGLNNVIIKTIIGNIYENPELLTH